MNGFINFWFRSMETPGERHNSKKSLPTIQCWPYPNAAVHLVILRSHFISAGRDKKKSTTCLNGLKSNSYIYRRISNYIFQRSKSNSMPQRSESNSRLFKILKISGPFLLAMTSSTLQPHFLSGFYYDKWWLSYPLHASVKLHPMTMHLDS